MGLSPAEIDRVAFRRPRPGTNGYSEDQVDAFLDDVAGEMRRLEAENRALSERLAPDDPEDLAERVRRAELDRLRAEEHARALRDELASARQSAGPPAKLDNPHMLELAQRNADEYVAEARREAETLLEQAGAKAAHLLSDAQLRASTIVADARHAHAEAIAGIEAQRTATLDELSELAALAERQRASVRGDITGRLGEFTA
ncbi:DivIVA domain-containing protein [Actinoplanes sp. L3-i22]|uniref:DivIVA domain-containing protein n=1 Tax=Actinoplanes sp. L3-i22 TaxID=2836373 RepID=UPI001C7424CD|nr:DivIVA domain-containing protein [Actinoplanes sp. L3-i22]BCY08147.1 cell wall synthesis protein Wag31 [Actinoplanes sp. L3-i22]